MAQPEKQSSETLNDKPVKSHLVLSERPLVVQTGLKALFGEHEAELLQHIIYCRESPFFDKLLRKEVSIVQHQAEDDSRERIYVHIPVRLMFDPWTGHLRHLGEVTFRRTIASCKSQGVLRTASRLDEDDLNDNTNWYAIVSEVLDPLTSIYEEHWARVQSERQQALMNRSRPPSEKQEDEIKKEMWEKIAAKRKELHGLCLIPKLNEPKKKRGKQPNGSPSQNDRVTRSKKSQTVHPLKMIESNLSKREGGSTQNNTVDSIEMTASLYKEVTESKDSETTIGDADASTVVDEKSLDFLSSKETPNEGVNASTSSTRKAAENVEDEVSKPKRTQTATTRLGGAAAAVVASGLSAWDALEEPARTLAQRFYDYAQGLGRDLDHDAAARLVMKSDVSKLSNAGLVSWITRDRERAGLSDVVGGQALIELKAKPDDLRWRLFTWRGFRQGVLEYYEKRKQKPDLTGAFLAKWRSDIDPDSSWLDELMREDAREQHVIEQKAQREIANAFYATLNGAQKSAFDMEMERARKSNGNLILHHSSEYDELRIRLLNDDEVRERLAHPVSSSETSQAQASTRSENIEESEAAYEPHPNVARNCLNVHVPKMLQRLKSGDLMIDDLPSACQKIASLTSKDARWLEDRVLEVWETSKVKAA